MSTQGFEPPRWRGMVIHTGLIIALLIGCAFFFSRAVRESLGPAFALYVLGGIATLVPLPVLLYRLYALQRAYYRLDRNMLVLSWGLRLEQIPLDDIEWVRPSGGLPIPLTAPPLSLPGALLGRRRHPDLGPVEFMASEQNSLLLVATARRVFAISPADPARFMHEFQRAVELGALEHTKGRSVYPSFILTRAWESPLARFLWLSGLLLNLGLLGWISLVIPTLREVHLGFSPSGKPFPPVPASQLIILPLASMGLSVVGWLTGLYFYRWPEQRLLSFLVWASSALTALIFVLAAAINLATTG